MKGRKPVPTELKILRGNPGQRRLNAEEAKPEEPISLDPPTFLNDVAKAAWADTAPMLVRLGLLTEVDRDAFTLYCQTFAQWKEAQAAIALHGMVMLTKKIELGGFPVISPWVRVAEKAHHQCAKMLIEFGLTPSSRSRVHVKPGATLKPDTKKERFFGRGRA